MTFRRSFPHVTRRRFPRKRKGILLFIVTVIIAILTLGGISLLALMRVERESTRVRLREIELTGLNRSAVVLIQATAEMTPQERERIGGIYDNPSLFCARNVLSESERSGPAGPPPAFTILSPRLEANRSGVRYGLVNESTRLNLGEVLKWDREKPGTGKEVLMRLPGMTGVMADSLLDWIDPDENTRPEGAEASYYARRKLAYSPRNALPISLDELLLVRGITRYQLYGTDVDFIYNDGASDQSKSRRSDRSDLIGTLGNPSPPANGMTGGVLSGSDASVVSTEVTIPWSRLLTVFSAERDLDPSGQPRVDLNEPDLSFLYDELVPRVGEEIAAFAILYRQFGPAPDASDAPLADLKGIDFTLPPQFTFKSPLDLVGVSVRVPATEGTPERIYRSPLSDRRQSVTDLFAYLDYVSIGDSAVITGRVNVNEAPEAVLSAIPGLTEEMVTRILNARSAPGQPVGKSRRHAAWLYADGIVDLPTMRELWSKLTTGGGVFRAQVVAFDPVTGESRRGEAVVDATVTPSRQVFYKDLSMYGRGFSVGVLTNRAGIAEDFDARLDKLLESEITAGSPFGAAENQPLTGDPFYGVDSLSEGEAIGSLGGGDGAFDEVSRSIGEEGGMVGTISSGAGGTGPVPSGGIDALGKGGVGGGIGSVTGGLGDY